MVIAGQNTIEDDVFTLTRATAWELGYAAARRGDGFDLNPYPDPQLDEFYEWYRGWKTYIRK